MPELPDGLDAAHPQGRGERDSARAAASRIALSRRVAVPRWAVVPAAVALIAIVALASRSAATGSVEIAFDTAPLLGALRVAGYVAEFAGLAGLLAAIVLYRAKTMRAQAGEGTKRRPPPMPWWAQLLGLLAVAAVVVGQIAIIVAYVFEVLRALRTRVGGGSSGGPLSAIDLSATFAGRDATAVLVAVVISVGLLVLLIAIAIRWRIQDRRFALAGPDEYRAATEAAVDISLDALRSEPDPRRAVIAAYAAMERALSGAGLGRHRSEAPLEYVRRVLMEQTRAPTEVRTITDLFQVAKFSQHPVDEPMRAAAIDALEHIRAATRRPA